MVNWRRVFSRLSSATTLFVVVPVVGATHTLGQRIIGWDHPTWMQADEELGRADAETKRAVLPLLIETAQHETLRPRWHAIRSLSRVADIPEAQTAVEPLASIVAQYDPDGNSNLTAINTLLVFARAGRDIKKAVPALIAAVGRERQIYVAIVALGAIGPDAAAAGPTIDKYLDIEGDDLMRDGDRYHYLDAEIAVESKGSMTTAALAKALFSSAPHEKWTAARAIASKGPEAVGPLRRVLENEEDPILLEIVEGSLESLHALPNPRPSILRNKRCQELSDRLSQLRPPKREINEILGGIGKCKERRRHLLEMLNPADPRLSEHQPALNALAISLTRQGDTKTADEIRRLYMTTAPPDKLQRP